MKKPESIGPYTLLSPLGDSVRNRTWLAASGPRQDQVVLKLAQKDNAHERARLLHELTVLAALDQENIVRLLDSGEWEGRMWMALTYIRGPSAPLQLANFRQLLLALVHVHAHGVVHADIKPANLLLDAQGDLHLAGFGNARRFGAGPLGPGGMPQYMSPEQLRGEALDVRADFFSAGAVLFQLLTGSRPFDGKAAPRGNHDVEPGLPLPSALVPGLGTGFDGLTSKLLAPDRRDRHDSAFAVLGDFDVACHRGVRAAA